MSSVAAAHPATRLAAATAQAALHARGGGPLLPASTGADGTLRRLYECSLQMFAERGYHAVSVRDITLAVGVGPSALYAHLPSKAHLLADLLRIGHEEHRDRLRLALLDAGAAPGEQLAAVVGAHVQVHLDLPLLTRVCNRELGSLPDDLRPSILALRTDANATISQVIERGQRLRAFADVDPLLAVAAIGGMGIRVAEWWRPDLGVEAADVVSTYVEFARKLLAPAL